MGPIGIRQRRSRRGSTTRTAGRPERIRGSEASHGRRHVRRSRLQGEGTGLGKHWAGNAIGKGEAEESMEMEGRRRSGLAWSGRPRDRISGISRCHSWPRGERQPSTVNCQLRQSLQSGLDCHFQPSACGLSTTSTDDTLVDAIESPTTAGQSTCSTHCMPRSVRRAR